MNFTFNYSNTYIIITIVQLLSKLFKSECVWHLKNVKIIDCLKLHFTFTIRKTF